LPSIENYNYKYTASSVAVEHVFSQGCFLLPYVHNRLSAQFTRALLCVGEWSLQGLVKNKDVKLAAKLPDVDEESELEEDWDKIDLDK
jgi:hypothetical protein